MPITVSCPSCGGTIKAPDNLAGRKVKCPKCTAVMMLPAGEVVADAIQSAPPPVPAAPPRQRASQAPPQEAPRRAADDQDDWDDDEPRRRDRDRDRNVDDGIERPRKAGVNGLAIAGMVLGIVGIPMVFIPCFGWVLAVVMGIIGATLSGIGLASAGKIGSGKGMAIAGLVLSIIAIIFVPVWIFLVVGMFFNRANQIAQQMQAAQNNPRIVFKDKGIQIQPNNAQGPPTAASGKLTLQGGQASLRGELTANDPRDRVMGHSACKVYTVSMAAGKTYQIDMLRDQMPLDPYLRLEDPAGNQLAQDDDGGGERNARILYTCQQGGEYRIVATSLVGTGPFTLQVSEK